MSALIEKMVILNKSKKYWTKFATKSSWNEKMLTNQQLIFYIKTCRCLGCSYILTWTLLMDGWFFKNARKTSTQRANCNLIVCYYSGFNLLLTPNQNHFVISTQTVLYHFHSFCIESPAYPRFQPSCKRWILLKLQS